LWHLFLGWDITACPMDRPNDPPATRRGRISFIAAFIVRHAMSISGT
jgi:hypothetical protein